MRHLLALPLFCIVIAACAAAPGTTGTPDAGRITLALHASAQLRPGITLSYESVDDSRCPPDARCVWAGALVYRFSLRAPHAAAERFALEPGKPGHASARLGGALIELDEAFAAAPPAQGAAPATPVALRIKSVAGKPAT